MPPQGLWAKGTAWTLGGWLVQPPAANQIAGYLGTGTRVKATLRGVTVSVTDAGLILDRLVHHSQHWDAPALSEVAHE
jgi:hypothetical protein